MGFAILLHPGNILQLIVATIFSLIALGLQLQNSPHRSTGDGSFRSIMLVSIVYIFIASSFLQSKATADLHGVARTGLEFVARTI